MEAEGGTPAEGRIFLLPRAQYEVIDTWDVCGLQATGSWDIVVDDVTVPAHRSQSMLDNFLLKGPGQAINTASLYRLPFGQGRRLHRQPYLQDQMSEIRDHAPE